MVADCCSRFELLLLEPTLFVFTSIHILVVSPVEVVLLFDKAAVASTFIERDRYGCCCCTDCGCCCRAASKAVASERRLGVISLLLFSPPPPISGGASTVGTELFVPLAWRLLSRLLVLPLVRLRPPFRPTKVLSGIVVLNTAAAVTLETPVDG